MDWSPHGEATIRIVSGCPQRSSQPAYLTYVSKKSSCLCRCSRYDKGQTHRQWLGYALAVRREMLKHRRHEGQKLRRPCHSRRPPRFGHPLCPLHLHIISVYKLISAIRYRTTRRRMMDCNRGLFQPLQYLVVSPYCLARDDFWSQGEPSRLRKLTCSLEGLNSDFLVGHSSEYICIDHWRMVDIGRRDRHVAQRCWGNNGALEPGIILIFRSRHCWVICYCDIFDLWPICRKGRQICQGR